MFRVRRRSVTQMPVAPHLVTSGKSRLVAKSFAMLNPNETVQFRRIPLLTPPGRPLEVGWAQEFARWLWHVFVLPADLAKPWPRWIHRSIKPLLLRLARQLGVSNARSIRSWALHLTLIDPPRG